jgi:insertion element IS1 protein InsB
MVLIAVTWPYCHSAHITKRGKTETDKQRYRCHTPPCPHPSCLLHPAYKGRLPAIKAQSIARALNGSGIRDTARVLGLSPDTVLNELKKSVNPARGQSAPARPVVACDVAVVMRRADAADADAMGAFVQRKKAPRGLWQAMDHRSGQVLAYLFGRRQDEVFWQRKALLEPCGITRYSTDSWGAHTRHLDTETSDVTHTAQAVDA